jgi:hypothetical protein
MQSRFGVDADATVFFYHPTSQQIYESDVESKRGASLVIGSKASLKARLVIRVRSLATVPATESTSRNHWAERRFFP